MAHQPPAPSAAAFAALQRKADSLEMHLGTADSRLQSTKGCLKAAEKALADEQLETARWQEAAEGRRIELDAAHAKIAELAAELEEARQSLRKQGSGDDRSMLDASQTGPSSKLQ